MFNEIIALFCISEHKKRYLLGKLCNFKDFKNMESGILLPRLIFTDLQTTILFLEKSLKSSYGNMHFNNKIGTPYIFYTPLFVLIYHIFSILLPKIPDRVLHYL